MTDSKFEFSVRVEPPVKRAPLKARSKPIDLESNLGKTTVISGNTPLSQQGGFYCSICDCVVKDSANFLDHINGKKRTFKITIITRKKCGVLFLYILT